MTQQQNEEEQTLPLPNFSAMFSGPMLSRSSRRRSGWRQPRRLIPIAILLLLIVAAAIIIPLLRGRSSKVTYQYQSVLQNDFNLSVQATGPLQSAVYNLVFAGSGRISEINVQLGQTVTKGQILAKLDMTSLQDAVNAAQAAVLTAQTAVPQCMCASGLHLCDSTIVIASWDGPCWSSLHFKKRSR
jgi:HlyD family secretion protein